MMRTEVIEHENDDGSREEEEEEEEEKEEGEGIKGCEGASYKEREEW